MIGDDRAIDQHSHTLDRSSSSSGTPLAARRRSFDRGVTIEDPAHVAELRKSKGEARKNRALSARGGSSSGGSWPTGRR